MEQVLNIPYENKITTDAIQEIITSRMPRASVKNISGRLFLKNNLLVDTRFSIRGNDMEKKVYFKTKMNVWALLIVIALLIAGGSYFYSERKNMRDTDYWFVGLTFLASIIIWLTYLIMKTGIARKMMATLRQGLPSYMSNRMEYYFPTNDTVARWKVAMKPVQVLVVIWGVVKTVAGFASYILPYYIGNSANEIIGYVFALCSFIPVAIAVIFVTKDYNHYWTIAKIFFMTYTCWLMLTSIATALNLWHYINVGKTVFIILLAVECCLLLTFAFYFNRALCNSSSLYLAKASSVWFIVYIPLYAYRQYFLSTDFSFASSEFQLFNMINSIVVVIANLIFTWGFLKAFATLPKHVPQGINIKI